MRGAGAVVGALRWVWVVDVMKRIPAPAELRRPAIVNLPHGVVGGEVGDDGLRRELVGAGPALRLAQPQHRHTQQPGLCKLPRDKLRKVAAELGGGRVGLRTPTLIDGEAGVEGLEEVHRGEQHHPAHPGLRRRPQQVVGEPRAAIQPVEVVRRRTTRPEGVDVHDGLHAAK